MAMIYEGPEDENSIYYHTAIMIGIFGGISLVAYAFSLWRISSEIIILLYLLGVVLIVWLTGRFSLGVISSIASTLVYYYTFASPRNLLSAAVSPESLITVGTMILVALITSMLISLIRHEAQVAKEKEKMNAQLLQLTNDLADAEDTKTIAGVAMTAISNGVGCDVGYFSIDDEGRPDDYYLYQSCGFRARLEWRDLEPNEIILKMMSRGERTYIHSKDFYEWPLMGSTGLIGAIRIPVDEQDRMEYDKVRTIHSIVDSTAMALDRFRSAELRLQAREEATEERFRATLLRSISHDIRTPLTSISGSAEMLMRTMHYSRREYQLARNIYEDAQHLSGMVENVLGITRLESGVQIKREMEVAEEVIGVSVQQCERHHDGYDIQVTLPDEILMVPMDASLVQQAITNILENAIHHTEKKDGVEIILERDGNDAKFTVRDCGEGINPDDLERLFEPFFQSNRGDRVVYRGFGLGLSICQSVVKAHGGKVWAQNRKDVPGAEIIFTLPMEVQDAAEERSNSGRRG